MTTDASAISLPATPRPLTPRARRRAWAEAPVRMWLLFGVVSFVVFGILVYLSAREALRERWLIEHGERVIAQVQTIGMNKDRSASREEAVSVAMTYVPRGQIAPVSIGGILPRKAGTKVSIGDEIPIHINPINLQEWTDLTEPTPWGVQFTAAYLVLPVWLLGLLGAWIRRKQMLATYRNGTLRSATVVGTRKPAIAPDSQVIRFVFDDGDDDRVYQCFWPARLGKLAPDDPVELIVPANPSLSVAAKAYS